MTHSVSENDHVRNLLQAAAFAELSQMLAGGEPVELTLLRIAQCLKDQVGGVGDVSVTVVDESTARTVVSTGARAIELDQAQYDLRTGPCLDAARTERTVLVRTHAPSQYHQFCQLAHSRGVGHIMSIGLLAPRRSATGVNVYGTGREPFDDEARSLAAAFANYATAAINGREPGADASGTLGWQAAFASRSAVDRAALTLMVSKPRTRDEAINELLGLARSQGRRLVQTAQSIIDG